MASLRAREKAPLTGFPKLRRRFENKRDEQEEPH
jgi:hypothetical protein